jgi:hypothetical protein
LIIGAIIGAAGAVAVAAGNTITTVWTKHSERRNARQQDLWQKQAALYVDLLAYVTHRSRRRVHETRKHRYAPEIEAQIEKTIDAFILDPFRFEGEVRAFASEAVVAAFLMAQEADQTARMAHADAQDAAKTLGQGSAAYTTRRRRPCAKKHSCVRKRRTKLRRI